MKLVKLSDLFRVSSSKRVLKSDWKDAGVPFYRGREITRLSKTGFADNELFISEEHFKDLSAKYGVPVPGDIMVTAIGTIGNTYIVNERDRFYFKDASVLWLHKEAEVDSRFIDYWLKSDLFFDQLDRGNGATVDTLTIEKLSNVKLLLPSLEKQHEIVEKLDSAFVEIDLLEVNLGLSKEKANQLLQSILNSEYSLTGLQLEPLEKLVDILDNQRIPVNATERLERLGDIPYYGATGQVGTIDKAIFNETLILLGEDGVPFFDPTKHKAYEITGPSWVNNHAHVLRGRSEIVIQRYLLHFLNIFNYTGYVNGSTRLKLTQGDMKRIPVPLPSMEVQAKIVSKIDLAFTEIDNLNEQLGIKKEFASGLRQSLLSSAFTEKESVS